MGQNIFTEEDLSQILEHGLTPEEVSRQLELFKSSSPYLNLARPCIKGDGIQQISAEQAKVLINLYERKIKERKCVKFVPASGAASRMFKTLLAVLGQDRPVEKTLVEKEARAGHKDSLELLKFMTGVERFAFFNDLVLGMSKQGHEITSLLKTGTFREIIRFLLTESGLNYASLPKGLLKFHSYSDGNRTSFEEHLVEAVSWVTDQERLCRLHFTVSPEHREKFESLLDTVKPVFEKKYQVTFRVSFSIQKSSTDTIAVDLKGNPFRDRDGRLFFRPGGHGALIENVNDLRGDIVFIKNIDNVVPDSLKADTIQWKKILGGYLITLQDRIFTFLGRLSSEPVDNRYLNEVMTFMEDELFMNPHDYLSSESLEEKKKFCEEQLNRPIRVCGMVKNEGEPGGGPFWVRDASGEISRQIVESAQVDPNALDQQSILASATHFNPVDLVCGVCDWQGRPFTLQRYVDEKAVFISRKSKDGKDLKALEHPGLWNGAMAGWITLFAEVPISTFNPVKTVNDLLREEHQSG